MDSIRSDLDSKRTTVPGISSALEAYFTIKYLPILNSKPSPTSLPLFSGFPSDYFNISFRNNTISTEVVGLVPNSGQEIMSRSNSISNCNDEKARASEFDSVVGAGEPTLQHTPTLLSSYVAPSRGIGSFFRTKSGVTNGNSSTTRDDWQVVGTEQVDESRTRGLTITGVLPAEGMRLGAPFSTTSTSTSTSPQQSRRNSRPNVNLLPSSARDRSSSNTGPVSISTISPTASSSGTLFTSPLNSPTKALPATPPSRRSSVEQNWSSRSISGSSSSRPPVSPTSYSPVSTRFRGVSSEVPRSPSNSQSLYATKASSTSSSNLNGTAIRPSEERTDSGGSNCTSSSSNSSHRGSSSAGTTNSSESSINSNGSGYGFFKRDNRSSPRRVSEAYEGDRGKKPDRTGTIIRNEEVEREADQAEEARSISNTSRSKWPGRNLTQDIPVSRPTLPSLLQEIPLIASHPTLPLTSLQQRRATLNIDNLHLHGFDTPVPSSSLLPSLPAVNSRISETTVESASVPSTIITSTTTSRLRTLPRLLSNDGYNIVYTAGQSNGIRSSPGSGGSEGSETEEDTENEVENGVSTETETEGETDTDASGSEGLPSPPAVLKDLVVADSVIPSPKPFIDVPLRLATRTSQLRPNGPQRSHSSTSPSSGNTWVTFAPSTPTPMLTARPVAEASTSQSYFDLPTRASLSRTSGPLMSPLVPMSQSSVARGKRPVREDEAVEVSTSAIEDIEEVESQSRISFYRRRSQSVLNVLSSNRLGDEGDEVGTAALGELDPVWQTGGMETPGPAFLSPLLSQGFTPSLPKPSAVTPKLNRPRSMYELHVAPPAYHAVYSRAGFGPAQIVFPREEEGIECLPDYFCHVHLEGYMPRKMEFTGPNIQAKSRGWSKQYVVLHGTSIKIYKYDLRTHPVEGLPNFDYTPAEIHPKDGPELLHVHPGEYRSNESLYSSTSSKNPIVNVVKAKAHLPSSHPSSNVLLRDYSLQNAESGLAADYLKRKHVVRVRAAGEQFLLKAKDDRGVIDLIEALQAATNTALDLDVRPLPKFITLPRRRRRRRIGNGTVTLPGPGQSAVLESTNNEDEGRLSDMLAEEQQSYSNASNASDI